MKDKPAVLPDRAICRQSHYFIYRPRNINEKWENIKTIIKVTKQQLIEKDEGTEIFKNKWYNEERKFAIEELKKAKEKLLIKGRREKEKQEYHHKRKEAHKIIRNKKKTYMQNVTESIEKIRSITTEE